VNREDDTSRHVQVSHLLMSSCSFRQRDYDICLGLFVRMYVCPWVVLFKLVDEFS